jgi:hypothetical protein
MKIITPNDTIEEVVRLSPGHKVFDQKLNISFGLKTFSIPPVPVLDKPFITDGDRILSMEASPPGQPTPGKIGSFQCETKEDAKEFNKCYFPPSTCTCQARVDRAACTCTPLDLNQLFNDHPNYLLPIQTPVLVLYPDKHEQHKSVFASFTQSSTIQINLEFNNYQINFKVHRTRCDVKLVSLAGCFECVTQSKLTLTCQTDQSSTLAVIDCEDTVTSIPCNASRVQTTISVAFRTQDVNKKCKVSCGGYDSTLLVKGTLARSPIKRIMQVETSFGDLATEEPSDSVQLSEFDVDNPLDAITELFSTTWMGKIVIILALIGVIVLTILIAPMCFTCFSSVRSGFQRSQMGYVPLNPSEFKERSVLVKNDHVDSDEPIRAFSPTLNTHFDLKRRASQKSSQSSQKKSGSKRREHARSRNKTTPHC